MRKLNSDMKAPKIKSVLFFLSTIWWLDALKRMKGIIRENAFEQKKKKNVLKLSKRPFRGFSFLFVCFV